SAAARPPQPPLVPYTTLFRSDEGDGQGPTRASWPRRPRAGGPVRIRAEVPARALRWNAATSRSCPGSGQRAGRDADGRAVREHRSEEHTSELQSREKLVCRLL